MGVGRVCYKHMSANKVPARKDGGVEKKIGKSVNLECELKNLKTCCPQTKKIAISASIG